MNESLIETERRLSTEEKMQTQMAQAEDGKPAAKQSTMPKSVGSILKVHNKTALSKTF